MARGVADAKRRAANMFVVVRGIFRGSLCSVPKRRTTMLMMGCLRLVLRHERRRPDISDRLSDRASECAKTNGVNTQLSIPRRKDRHQREQPRREQGLAGSFCGDELSLRQDGRGGKDILRSIALARDPSCSSSALNSHQLKQDEGYRLLGRIERLVLEYEIYLHAHDCDEETSGPILANGNYSTQLCRPCMAVARL